MEVCLAICLDACNVSTRKTPRLPPPPVSSQLRDAPLDVQVRPHLWAAPPQLARPSLRYLGVEREPAPHVAPPWRWALLVSSPPRLQDRDRKGRAPYV